jgi:hypothetical protein
VGSSLVLTWVYLHSAKEVAGYERGGRVHLYFLFQYSFISNSRFLSVLYRGGVESEWLIEIFRVYNYSVVHVVSYGERVA